MDNEPIEWDSDTQTVSPLFNEDDAAEFLNDYFSEHEDYLGRIEDLPELPLHLHVQIYNIPAEFLPYGCSPDSRIRIRITNIVSTFHLGQSFSEQQYRWIARHGYNTELKLKELGRKQKCHNTGLKKKRRKAHPTKQFYSLVVRFRQRTAPHDNDFNPPLHNVTATIFKNGKVNLAGAETTKEVFKIANRLVKYINFAQSIGSRIAGENSEGYGICRLLQLRIRNINSVLKLPYEIRIERLHDDIELEPIIDTYFSKFVYEPVRFPAIRAKLNKTDERRQLSINIFSTGSIGIAGAVYIREIETCARFLQRLLRNYGIH